jgi:hypothetical protein
MKSNSGRAVFLGTVAILSLLLAVGVYQIPEPERPWLIGFVIVSLFGGWSAFKIVSAILDYRAAQALAGAKAGKVRAPKVEPAQRVSAAHARIIKPVVHQVEQPSGGREVVR